MNPIDAIIEAQRKFIKAKGGKEPTKVFLPRMMAFDIAQLKRSEIGPIADELMRGGIKALKQLFGMEVFITDEDALRLD